MLPNHTFKLRLGLHASDPSDGRSLSRLLGPFNLMRRQDPRLEIVLPPRDAEGSRMDWDYFTSLDVMYFLDPHTVGDLARVELAKACGCKVWVDFIDDLTNVPPSNPFFHHYLDKEGIRERMAEIIAMADLGTATTLTLKRRLPNNERVVVLPESCRWHQNPLPRTRRITWRGLGSHNEDLESILPQLREVSHMPQFSQWEWVFIGEPNWKIHRDVIPKENLVIVPPRSPYEFMNTWGNLAPFLHIAPIVDNPFNRAKTPLVWMEATAVGAAVIGPNLPEWNACPGMIQYDVKNPETFGEALKRELSKYEEGKFHPNVAESRNAVYPDKTTEVINGMRWGVLSKFAGAAPQPEEESRIIVPN